MSRRRVIWMVSFVCALAVTAGAFAELQNVTVGGSIRIRANYYSGAAAGDSLTARNPYFQPPWTTSFRGVPGGNPAAGLRWPALPGRQAVFGIFSWNDDASNDLAWAEQRTTLNVRGDFTDNVSAFIEFDAYNVWGEDFRSNYTTGVDMRGAPEVELYQSYIEAREMFGQPLRLRIGRQELFFGNGWLVSPNDTAALFFGTSFDGVRLTYATDLFSVDAFATKLAETSPIEQDGDTDFYGLYASYLGIEDFTIDGYWLLLRDAGARADTYGSLATEWIEDVLGVDDYDVTTLHTVGLRAAGSLGQFDIESEVTYQFGEADSVGSLFAGAGMASPYGPDDAEWDTWAGNVELGYTFNTAWSPRVFIGGVYFGGEDNRDLDFVDWLGAAFYPFWHAAPSVSFNRLFSHAEYTEFIENTDLSNAWIARCGVSANLTESLTLTLLAAHFEAVEPYAAPWPTFDVLGLRFFPLGELSFLSKDNSTDLGTEVELIASYAYSEDLTFEAGWSHFFTGDGMAEGSFSAGNGLLFNGGTDDDDADYVYFETKLTF